MRREFSFMVLVGSQNSQEALITLKKQNLSATGYSSGKGGVVIFTKEQRIALLRGTEAYRR
jgi:hypothetical protein